MLKYYIFIVLSMFMGCANNQYMPDGCQLNSYRLIDGTMKYYYSGKNCNRSYDLERFHESRIKN